MPEITKRPLGSVMVERPEPTTLTRIPEALAAEPCPEEEAATPPVSTVPLTVAVAWSAEGPRSDPDWEPQAAAARVAATTATKGRRVRKVLRDIGDLRYR
jgi:hypothetical protein